MKKYSSYKQSGIDWIGEIPENWKLSKVKYTTDIFGRIGYRGYTIEDIVNEGEGVITISPSNIKNDLFTIEGDNTYISFEKYYQSPEIMIFPNDIILVKTGSTIGKTSIIPDDVPKMTINPQLVVLKNIRINNKYFFYQTVCSYFKLTFWVEQTGSTTPTISQEKMNEFKVLVPSLPEQLQIVQFLDEKTEIIDKLISTKERKIDLLKQQRSSLINEVVTKGLDPKVKMKDSGVEWIGEIPEHWKISKLNFLLKGIKDGTHGTHQRVDNGFPLLSGKNVLDTGIDTDDFESQITEEEHLSIIKNGYPKKGDVLITIVGSIGRCCVYEMDYSISFQRSVCFLRPKETINRYFLKYQIQSNSIQNQLVSLTKKSTQGGVYIGELKELRLTLPTMKEQLNIVEYLDIQTKELNDLISLEQKKINILKEYRQSLISEVITGKIDVRTNPN